MTTSIIIQHRYLCTSTYRIQHQSTALFFLFPPMHMSLYLLFPVYSYALNICTAMNQNMTVHPVRVIWIRVEKPSAFSQAVSFVIYVPRGPCNSNLHSLIATTPFALNSLMADDRPLPYGWIKEWDDNYQRYFYVRVLTLCISSSYPVADCLYLRSTPKQILRAVSGFIHMKMTNT